MLHLFVQCSKMYIDKNWSASPDPVWPPGRVGYGDTTCFEKKSNCYSLDGQYILVEEEQKLDV